MFPVKVNTRISFLFADKALVIMILLASLNSCCNPWIYMAFSGTFSCCTMQRVKRCFGLEKKLSNSKGTGVQHSLKGRGKSNSVTTTPLTRSLTRSPSWVKLMTHNQITESNTWYKYLKCWLNVHTLFIYCCREVGHCMFCIL